MDAETLTRLLGRCARGGGTAAGDAAAVGTATAGGCDVDPSSGEVSADARTKIEDWRADGKTEAADTAEAVATRNPEGGSQLVEDFDSDSDLFETTDADTLTEASWKYGEMGSDGRSAVQDAADGLSDSGKQDLLDSLGSADDASTFRAGLDEIRSSSDVDVGEYFDGSDALPKRAKGRIVDVVGDSDSLSGADAADARDALRNLDDVSHREISTFIDDGETGGVGFLSEVDQSTVDNVFSFDVGGGSTDIAVRTRAGIAQAYNRNHFSTSEWAGDVYPDATDAEGVVNKIADDINALSGRDDVVGLARTLGKGSDGGTGSYFVDLPSPAASSNPVKGVSLEIRAAATEATDLGDNVLRLSYEPEVDFTELSDSAVQDIADKISDDTSTVENALIDGDSSRDVELDAFRDSESGTDIYFEPKNRDSVSSATVRDQIIRYFGVQKSEGIGLENSDVTVYVRSESQASDLEGAFDSSWFTVKTPSDE